jgi:FkbM family methyltransferase
MKFKELFYAIGLKPALRTYPFKIVKFSLPTLGDVSFAQWQHPSARRRPTKITQGMVDVLSSFLNPGDVAIDIGAHVGDSTIPLALAVGPQGLVLALEPNPYAFHVLLANSGLNRLFTNIHPLMYAATPEDRDYEFGYTDSGFCNGGFHPGISKWRHAHFFKLRVTGINLVSYLDRHYRPFVDKIRYIKLDTEGFDAGIVGSLQPLIDSNRPYLRTEIYKHTGEANRIAYLRFLRDMGYQLHYVSSEEHFLGEVVTEKDVMRWSHFDVFAVPNRCS